MSEEINGKIFSIMDPKGVNTVIYRINKTAKEYANRYPKYTVDYPEPEGEDLVFLSFGNDKVIVNMGKLKNDKVKISKTPIPVKFDTVYSEKPTEYKDFKYTPSLNRAITIIDPETTEEVKPMLYLDKETNEVKGKCKLKPYKSYFTFEITDNNE